MAGNKTTPHRGPRLLLACAVIVLCSLVSAALIYTSPTTEKIERKRPPKLVQTMKVQPRTEPIAVTAYGVVIPAREVTVEAEVRGRVIRQNTSLVPGGFIPRGEELIHIDPSDYTIALEETEAAFEEAEFELAVEQGRQVVASREWKLLQSDLSESEANRSLALREPHLKKAEALVRKAQNRIKKAKLDLSRTTVVAPFNAVVLDEQVEVGQLVDRGITVCTLAGSDAFWVRVSLPIDKLRWIRLPDGSSPGAKATVFLDSGRGTAIGRDARVVRLLSDLDPKGRMARILISVPDPLGLHNGGDALPLLLSSYVRVRIDAGELTDVIAIPRSALREGNRIWVVGTEHELEIRNATIVWAWEETLYLPSDCIEPDEELVISGLRLALPQMKVSPQRTTMNAEDGVSGKGSSRRDG